MQYLSWYFPRVKLRHACARSGSLSRLLSQAIEQTDPSQGPTLGWGRGRYGAPRKWSLEKLVSPIQSFFFFFGFNEIFQILNGIVSSGSLSILHIRDLDYLGILNN